MTVPAAMRRKTFLGYELTSRQDAIVNYLLPSLCASGLYMVVIASDIAVIVSHYRTGDPIWASLTIFFLYLPALASYIIIISNWELWPEFESCSRKNVIWAVGKTLEHLLFPVWNMWRFAERIFWSIEAVTAVNLKEVNAALSYVTAPRSIELYVFLQSYLHAIPQVLLQLYILMRHNAHINRETEKAQFISIVLNIMKVSVTTTYYQRFKSQKLAGKQYPWFKDYKLASQPLAVTEGVTLRRPNFSESRIPLGKRRNTSNLEEQYALESPQLLERRRSSDIYLEPTSSTEVSHRPTLLETDFDEITRTKIIPVNIKRDEGDGLTEPTRSLPSNPTLRTTSITEGSKTMLFRQTGISDHSEPDFNISRVMSVKGLEDDDFAGRMVAFLWWFTFLLARFLAISVYAYFFMSQAIWLLSSHYSLVLLILLYDAKTDQVKRSKILFFLFIGFVYLFCIIEFKIKFKKAKFLYYGYFLLVFTENFIMCLFWFIGEIDSIENDFWFRYVFYVFVGCSMASFSSMVFYFLVNQPPKIIVETKIAHKNNVYS